ncbi:MAG: heme o synthase [Bacteroidota bacterium]
MHALITKIRLYWPLIKSTQTGLLLATGVAGFLSAGTPVGFSTLLGLIATLALAISGSTILNMWYDHDIDARMKRTHKRPAAAGMLSREEVFRVGMAVSLIGVGGAFVIAPLYGAVVFAGWFFDVIVYTLWLKRRTAWSILWGGISGAMPILSGHALGAGRIDLTGILLALAVLFWIPTHTLTFSLKFREDYSQAGVPTFPSTYGDGFTRAMIAVSSVLAAIAIGWASILIGIGAGYLRLMAVLSAGLLLLAFATFRVGSERINLGLFKYASIYMLAAMIILAMRAL